MKKFLAFCTLILIPLQSFAFGDIYEGDPQRHMFEHLRDVGIMGGYEDGNFHPEKLVTRAEAVMIALRAGGIAVLPADGTSYFTDVDPNEWYAPVINRAVDTEVVFKNGDQFWPNNIVTKGQFLAMLFRATQVDFSPYYGKTNIAKDIEDESWYVPHFAYAKQFQIAKLPLDGMYRPDKPLSRREVAIMTFRQLRIFYGDEVTKVFIELQAVIELFIEYLQSGEEDKATMQLQRIVELTNSMTRMQNNEDAIAANAISLAMMSFSESLQALRYKNYLKFLSNLYLAEKQAARAQEESVNIAPFAEKLILLIEETLTSFSEN